jgi:hypothetical protein
VSTEHFGTSPKKGRGMVPRSLDLIEAMHAGAKVAGVGDTLLSDGTAARRGTGGRARCAAHD